MIHNIISDKATKLFIILGCFFVANALIAEFMGVKIFSLEKTFNLSPVNLVFFGSNYSFNLTAGVLLWPVVFIMTDIINEYFGQRGVRFLSYITIALISYAFLMVFVAIKTSPADFWIGTGAKNGVPDMNVAYSNIFGQGLWIIIGSLVAFLVGQVV
ncbi:MAG TPA: VUT family protein, partial [Segetibacter sp.]